MRGTEAVPPMDARPMARFVELIVAATHATGGPSVAATRRGAVQTGRARKHKAADMPRPCIGSGGLDQSPLISTTPTVSGATTAITARAIGSQPGWRPAVAPNCCATLGQAAQPASTATRMPPTGSRMFDEM